MEIDEVQTEGLDEVETEETEVEDAKGETVRETVERAIQKNAEKEASAGDPGDEDPEATKPQKPVAQREVKNKKDSLLKDVELDPTLQPPERLNAEEKQIFNNLPKGLKRAWNKSLKNQEALVTKTQQELAPLRNRYQRIDEILSTQRAEWQAAGIPDEQAIAQLVDTHVKLKNPHLPSREQTGRWLMHNCGLAHLLKEEGDPSISQPESIQSHPEFLALQNELYNLRNQIQPIQSSYQQSIQQFENAQIDTATREMYAVKHEKDQAGNYRYPELHDDSFLESLKPLVSGLKGTDPTLTYGEALKRAYIARTGKGYSPQPIQTGLPARSNTQRQIAPALSVRGGSTSPKANGMMDIPPEALGSVRDSVAAAIAANRAGRG